jgi:hypothetical protein
MKSYISFGRLLIGLISCVLISFSSISVAAPPVKTSNIKGDAFILAGNTANTCNGILTTRVIDNPLANGNPNAIVMITHNDGVTSGNGFNSFGPYSVYYDDNNTCGNGGGYWVIANDSTGGESITSYDRFNVLIITP